MKKKIMIMRFHHETNCFCPNLADETAYKNYCFEYGEHCFDAHYGVKNEMGAFLDVFSERDDIETVPCVSMTASPCGPVTASVYNFVLGETEKTLKEKGPFDGVLISAHGAMVAQGHCDGEGDLLQKIREITGYDIPIIMSVDLHANITEKMAKNADAITVYEKYPHTDTYETGYLAAKLMADTLDGKIKPCMAYRRIPFLLPLFPHEHPAIVPLYEKAQSFTAEKNVLSVRFAHGFFPSDIEEMGMSVVVVTDGDKNAAEKIADDLASEIEKRTPELKMEFPSLDAALDIALTEGEKPVVIADASDNPGAGALSDTTHILKRILERGIKGAVIATIVDPESVEKCIKAGVGEEAELSLGGKSDPQYSGGPLNVRAYVKMLSDGKYISKAKIAYGAPFNHGKTAITEVLGNTVIITSIPRQPWDIEIFRSHGIAIEEKKILVVKSTIHYRASYGEIAREMIGVSLPGYSVPVPEDFEYKNWKGEL